MKIKKRDGTVAEVSDTYIIADGESVMTELQFMDSGSASTDADVAFAVLATAHQMYRDDISNRWRSDRWQDKPSGNLSIVDKSNPVIGSGNLSTPDKLKPAADHAAVDAAHAQYRADLENRWRK